MLSWSRREVRRHQHSAGASAARLRVCRRRTLRYTISAGHLRRSGEPVLLGVQKVQHRNYDAVHDP